MEIFKKIDDNTLEITPEPKQDDPFQKKLDELQADLIQAEDSLKVIKEENTKREADIQTTVDKLQARLDEAIKLNLKNE